MMGIKKFTLPAPRFNIKSSEQASTPHGLPAHLAKVRLSTTWQLESFSVFKTPLLTLLIKEGLTAARSDFGRFLSGANGLNSNSGTFKPEGGQLE